MRLTYQEMYEVLNLADLVGSVELASYEDYIDETDVFRLSRGRYEALRSKQDDIKVVVVAFEMSGNHLGGDDVVGFVDQAIGFERQGYRIELWYGDEAEVLIVGIRKGSDIQLCNELEMQQDPPDEK